MSDLSPDTVVVHAGRPPRLPGGPLSTPVTFAAPFHAGVEPDYARSAEPTAAAFEEAIGALEGGEAVAFASGMAAIDATLETLVPVGGTVIAPIDSYSGTKDRLVFGAREGRWSVRWVDLSDPGAAAEIPAHAADLVWVESPSNPELRVADVPALCRLGVPVVVDNTFATPLNQRPLAWGATAVVHSATKLLSGHSDILAGVAVAAPAVAGRIRAHRTRTGAVLGPMEAFLALRGLRTLGVRLTRAQATAAVLADRLAAHPAVARVRYPGLPSQPGHRIAVATMASGFGTIVSFEPSGGADAAERIATSVRLIVHATSLGGVETTLDRRGDVPAEAHVSPALLRLSVGLEDPEDLWRDLAAALA